MSYHWNWGILLSPVSTGEPTTYLGWLMFATALNYKIMELNPNAETLVPGQRTINIDAGGNSAETR